MDIAGNLNEVNKAIDDPGCTLVAVSKTKPPKIILKAYEAGHRDFGENRVQELVSKYEALPKDIRWHMIGHLQRNKVKYIAEFVHMIQGVDTEKLLREINKQAARINRIIPCLLQVHIAREETKFGFDENELIELLGSGRLHEMDHVDIRGLMGMATFTKNLQQVREEFKSLKTLFDKLRDGNSPENVRMEILSMGMSGDFHVALEEGSNLVRIGTSIFGEREKA